MISLALMGGFGLLTIIIFPQEFDALLNSPPRKHHAKDFVDEIVDSD